jgi:ankyrin repeat protein
MDMDTSKLQSRFSLGRQSSLAPDHQDSATVNDSVKEPIDPPVRLMYLANEGDLEGINELLDGGSDVNFRDIDGRTALHIAACQGRTDVVQLLLRRGAEVDPQDRWCSTVMQFNLFCFFDYVLVSLLLNHISNDN